jgi:glycosyltransferase involved in cell wall biosynthesis
MRKLLFVHHFPLNSITGVTVLLRELIPTFGADIQTASQCFVGVRTAPDLKNELTKRHADAAVVIGFNLQIEVDWPLTLGLVDWCAQYKVPFYVYVFDYWPHHRSGVEFLISRNVRLLASTQYIAESLAGDGFPSRLVAIGVRIPSSADMSRTAQPSFGPKIVASSGRLVPRKRFLDIVRAFTQCQSRGEAGLELRLFPSLVYDSSKDEQLFSELELEARSVGNSSLIALHRNPPGALDCTRFAIYVCASEYEGFSMPPIEAAYVGCPPLMSDIAPHRAIANRLFAEEASLFLFPVGDAAALAELIRDELASGRRRTLLAARRSAIQSTIRATWSLQHTACELASLADTRSNMTASRDGAIATAAFVS